MNSLNQQPEEYLGISQPSYIITINSDTQKKISYLCSKIPSQEWVASIFWKHQGVGLKGVKQVEVFDIYPQHKAHGMSFDADFNIGVIDYMMDKGYENCFIGMIHSHCNTSVFFSGPDNQELDQNAKAHPIYLSVITNNKGEYTAKMAKYYNIQGSFTGTKVYKDVDGNTVIEEYNKPTDQSYTEHVKCNVVTAGVHTSGFPEFDIMVDKIMSDYNARNAKASFKGNNPWSNNNYQGYSNDLYSDYEWAPTSKNVIVNSAIDNENDRDKELDDILVMFLNGTTSKPVMNFKQNTSARTYNKNTHSALAFTAFCTSRLSIDEKGIDDLIFESIDYASSIDNKFCITMVKYWEKEFYDKFIG